MTTNVWMKQASRATHLTFSLTFSLDFFECGWVCYVVASNQLLYMLEVSLNQPLSQTALFYIRPLHTAHTPTLHTHIQFYSVPPPITCSHQPFLLEPYLSCML